jgi:hypothetical protein
LIDFTALGPPVIIMDDEEFASLSSLLSSQDLIVERQLHLQRRETRPRHFPELTNSLARQFFQRGLCPRTFRVTRLQAANYARHARHSVRSPAGATSEA